MNYGRQVCAFLLLLLVAHSQIPTDHCPALCSHNCQIGVTCNTCYLDFLANSPTTNTTCTCPTSMYSTTTGTCLPCPIRCLTCSNTSFCNTCIPGYMISNSYQCIPNTTNDNNWVSKNVSVGLLSPGLMGMSPLSIFKNNQIINVTQADIAQHESQCLGLGNLTWFGGYAQFDYSTKIFKTIYNLPHHQWINIRFQAVLVDDWRDNTLMLELNQISNYDPNSLTMPTAIWSGKFNSSERYLDFCGNGSIPDNLVVVDAWMAHSSSMVKIQIRLNQSNTNYAAGSSILNAFFGIKDLFVRVGSCGRNCQLCSSPYQCTQCYAPYMAINGTCICDSQYGLGFPTQTGCSLNCVEGQYYNTTALACIDCSSHFTNCYSCNNLQCLTCGIGFFHYTDTSGNSWCKQFCPQGWTQAQGVSFNITNTTLMRDQCVQCPTNCSTCNGNICLFCLSGFNYLQGSCVSTCPSGYYSSLGVCKLCSVGCQNCSSSSCQVCMSGYSTINGMCTPSCVVNSTSSLCSFNCSASCASCYGPSASQCLSCNSGTLSQGTCVSSCQPGEYALSGQQCARCPYGCNSCDVNNCFTCITGFFFLASDMMCHRICPTAYFPQITTVTVNGTNTTQPVCSMCAQGCTRCMSLSFCLACDHSLTLFNFICTSTQQDMYEWVNGSYQKCPINCLSCRHKVCTRCASGWHLDRGECLLQCPTNKYDKIIEKYINGTLLYSYEVCTWKNPMCETMVLGSCQQCSYTYPAAIQITNNTTNSSSCSFYCPQFYTKDQFLNCIACPMNCRRCQPDLTCLKCLDNYVINHPSLLTSSNINNQSCLLNTCPSGYFSDSLQCQKCQMGCDACLLDGSCAFCSTTWFVLDTNTKLCHDVACVIGQYYSTNDNLCHNCAPECQTCYGSPTYCTSCFSNPTNQTYLSSNTCVSVCPLGTFVHPQSKSCRACDPRCTSCSSFRNCTSCSNNFYLLTFYDITHTPCVSECPIGFYVHDNNVCTRCQKDCKSCYGPSEYQCLECYPNFSLDDGKCIYFCSAMKYKDLGSGHCQWCHSSCQECWGPTRYNCLTCKANYFIYNHGCHVNSCPGATYLSIPQQRLCQSCQFGCQICQSSQFCQFCTPGYNFYQGWCYLNHCPNNLQAIYRWYYSNPPVLLQGGICQGCSSSFSSNCLQCNTQSCKQCQSNLYLWRGTTQTITQTINGTTVTVIQQCLTSCPLGTYLLTDGTNQCMACSANCYSCSSYGSCTQCNSGYNIVNGYCTMSCPSGTFVSSASCVNCPTTCTSCINSTVCSGCQHNLYLYYSTTLLMTTCIATCPTTYYADPSGWCLKCPSTCVSCLNATSCTQCINGYSVNNGRCTNSSSTTCIANCGQCQGGICYQCHSPYLLLTNQNNGTATCISTCPMGFYPQAFSCQRCNATCSNCLNTENYCTSCVSGRLLYKNSCVAVCPTGYFPDVGTVSCSVCPNNCLTCNMNTCMGCKSGYYLYSGACYSQCPSGTFANPSKQLCFNCPTNCTSCTDIQNCTACTTTHNLYLRSCISQCPPNTYISTSQTTNLCKLCVAPCYTCSDSTNCLTCIASYMLNGTLCQQQCGDGYYQKIYTITYSNQVSNQNYSSYSRCEPCSQHCLTCTNSSTYCLSCPEYMILSSGHCVENCPDTTFSSSGVCINCPPACLKCYDQSTCQTCISGASLHHGKCQTSCPQGYTSVIQTNSEVVFTCIHCSSNCQTCQGQSQYDCITCEQGYFQLNSMCLSSCPPGYFANEQSQSCQECPSTCTHCSSQSKCSQCKPNHTLSSTDQCDPNTPVNCTIPSCAICSYYNNSVCWQCVVGYSVSQGICVSSCPAGQYSHNGKCVGCVANCLQCSASGCSTCNTTFYLYNGNCYSTCPAGTVVSTTNSICQTDPCLYHNTTYPNSCLRCASPYFLAIVNTSNSEQQCVITCPSGFVQSNSQCVSCPFNCLSCASQSECTVCQTSTYLYQGKCRYICPIGTYADQTSCLSCNIPFCLQCSSASSCTVCDQASGASLSNGQCVINCPVGTYRDSQLSMCANCPVQCSECTNSSYCLTCLTGKLYYNKCVNNCPTGTYASGSNCLTCGPGCFMCYSSTNCSFCQPGYSQLTINNVSSCVSNCPSGYYSAPTVSTLFSSSNSDICLPCSAPCLTCSTSGTTCTSCDTGFNLQGNICNTNCSNGYYPILEVSTSFFGFSLEILLCFPCHPSCLTCSSWLQCTSCPSGMLLDPYGDCLSGCTDANMYYNSTTRLCSYCSTTCYTCNGPSSTNCISCSPPLQLYQGSCVSTCPFGQYSTTEYICQPCNSNCADCRNSSNNCSICASGAYLQTSATGSVCMSGCGGGYYLDTTTQTCLICDASCLNCTNPTTSGCSACVSTMVLSQGQCITSCPTGTYMSTVNSLITCQTCPQYCLSCVSSSSINAGNCTLCQSTFYLINGTCLPNCPLGTYPSQQTSSCIDCGLTGCQNCIFNSSYIVQCTLCQSGYYMMADTLVCVTVCPSGYTQSGSKCVPNPICQQYLINGYCLSSCPLGTYPTSTVSGNTTQNACINCSSYCISCSSINQCNKCSNDTVLSTINNVTSCLTYCPTGYYNRSGTCLVCPLRCTSCVMGTTGISCSSCGPNFYLLNGKCMTACPSGYFASATVCLPCASNCAQCVTSATNCLICANNLYSTPNCVSLNCTSTQYQTLNGSCANCDPLCSSCYGGNSYQCSGCAASAIVLNGQCVASCPAGYYAMNGSCLNCPSSCQICTNSSVCTVCSAGFYLDTVGMNCLANCQALNTASMTYYASNNTCLPCSNIDVNCQVCTLMNNNTMQCTVCITSAYLLNNACVTTCPPGTYPSTTTPKQCLTCPINCTTCISSGCTSCSIGLVLSNSQCISSCTSGYYISTVNSTSSCQSCGQWCDTCSTIGACTSCIQPFLLVSGTCSGCIAGYFFSANLSICVLCSSQCGSCSLVRTNCTSCAIGYMLYLSNQCVATCPSGYYNLNNQCTACSVNNCSTCPTDICQQCQTGYVLISSGGNLTCSSSCPSSTFLGTNTNTCHSCSNNCITCTSATQCTQCNNNTNLYLGYCLTTCPSGYAPLANICTNCLTGCKTCTLTNNCTICTSGLTNDGNGTCSFPTNNTVNCSNGYYPNTLGNCSQCYPTCQTCSGPSVSNCLTCFSGSTLINAVCITTCNVDSFYNNVTCQLCNTTYTNCVTCTANACTSCATNFSLISNGTCTQTCPNGTYLTNQQCLSCSAFCLTCTSSTSCTSCLSGTTPPIFLYGGACQTSCPQLTYQNGTSCSPCDQTCLTCSMISSNCSSCLSPYNLHGTSCIISCPNGTFTSSNSCLNCSTNCMLCSNANNCTLCTTGLFLVNGTCRSNCTSGYYIDTVSSRCLLCVLPCTQCISRTSCSACDSNYTLNGTICQGSCPQGQYHNSTFINCSNCFLQNCGICSFSTCFSCATGFYAYYFNGALALCDSSCLLTGTYADNTTMTCQNCYANCDRCLNAIFCTQCSANYYLLSLAGNSFNECLNICPLGYFQFIDSTGFLASSCMLCSNNCNQCLNATYCVACQSHYYRYTTQNTNTATNVTCVSQCPSGYANPTVISGTGMCSLCGANCLTCTDSITCTQCISTLYVIVNGLCTPYNCLDCLLCSQPTNVCNQCIPNFYLFNSGCTSYCPNGYYADNTTGICTQCVANCDICFAANTCAQCITSYIFVDATLTCENQGFVQFGAAGNMSGFTSNITEIMATTYVATSSGPIAFGALTNTYSVMQVCQFMYLMAGTSDGNPEMVTFLDSMSICSYTNAGNTSANTTNSTTTNGTATANKRRLTQINYTDSFFTTAAPIFIIMACFLAAYIVVVLFQKYGQNCCSSSPCLQRYMRYTCQFMERRFRWTYVDLVMWISYLPFLYFAILQVKGVRWDTGLNIFSSLLAYVIIIVYPLYPFFILRKIFDKSDDRRENLRSYKTISLKLPIDQQQLAKRPLCEGVQCCARQDPNASLIEMSLSPWIDKVVRPVYNVDIPEYAEFRYFTIPHWRLAYAAIKYVRKFLFVLFLIVMPTPIAALSSLIALSVVYMTYLFVLRPKEKLYLILEIILEFLILGFEIFMLVYVVVGGATVTAMSIVAHAIGFAMANSTLAIAIILNLLAYYTIFCCIIDCIKHLKDSQDRHERGEKDPIDDIDEKGDLDVENGEYDFPDDPINVDLEKDLIRKFDLDDHPEQLVANMDMEKELVRDFGRLKDQYPDVIIPVDLEKQIVRDFGGDQCPALLVKNNDLEKDLVRNFGREKDGDDYPENIIDYTMEKQMVRDFGGDDRPQDLVKNNDMQKDLVRNFGRLKDGDDYPENVIEYTMEKQIIRDFGGEDRPQDLIANNDMEKDFVRNFGRLKEGDDYPENVIEYDLQKQMVRDFGGDNQPQELVQNIDMEKDLVRNIGRVKEGDDYPETVVVVNLEKQIIRDFGGQDRPQDLVKNNDLEKKLIRNFGRVKEGDDYPEPVIDITMQKNLVRNFGGDAEPEQLVANIVRALGGMEQKELGEFMGNLAQNNRQGIDSDGTEENNYEDLPLEHIYLDEKEMQFNRQAFSSQQDLEDYSEMPNLRQTVVRSKKNMDMDDKVEVLKVKGEIRQQTDKYRRNQKSKEPEQLQEEQSSEHLFFSPNKNNFTGSVDQFGSHQKIKPKVQDSHPTKAVNKGKDNLRATDGFGQFQEIAAKKAREQKIKKAKYDEDAIGEVIPKQKTNKYRKESKHLPKTMTNTEKKPSKMFAQEANYNALDSQSNDSVVFGEVRPPPNEKPKNKRVQDTYSDIKLKNKEQVFKQDVKKKQENLIDFDNDEFEDVNFEKPKNARSRSRNKDGQSSGDESKIVRKRRSSALMKNQKRSANLLVNEDQKVESDSNVSQGSRRSKILKPRGQKSGVLNIEDSSNNEDLQEFKL